ncbi:MAG: hypothetical protein ACRDK2_08620 [Solirubrobacteraceae bacterium]
MSFGTLVVIVLGGLGGPLLALAVALVALNVTSPSGCDACSPAAQRCARRQRAARGPGGHRLARPVRGVLSSTVATAIVAAAVISLGICTVGVNRLAGAPPQVRR